LDLTKGYAGHESETLLETVKSGRSAVTATSTPEDVLRQEQVIADALKEIIMVAEQYPEMKANQTYLKTMNAVATFETMVRTSCLIYNDSVAKLNREIRTFPTCLVVGMLGFQQKQYLVEEDHKPDMSDMIFEQRFSGNM
jgi:LemA protein